MDIAVLTSLYPQPMLPFEGIFAERRWRGMAARGHTVRVVQPLPHSLPVGPARWRAFAASPREEHRCGVPVHRPRYLHIPKLARGNATRFARVGMQELLRHGRPDVVVFDYAWPAGFAAGACRDAGLPCVVSGRGSDVLQVADVPALRSLLVASLQAAGHWCAVSRDLVDHMDTLGNRPGHGVLVPNGVDLELFRIRDRAAARRELGHEHGGPIVLVSGHLIARKDPLLALEAFVRGAPGNAQIVFVGRGPLRKELAARIEALSVGDRAFLLGEVQPETLATWYGACDMLLLTSWREGRPNVVLETLASGRPALATEAGGTGEILGHLDGMFSKSRDADTLAGMIRALLARTHDEQVLRAEVASLSWDASLKALEGCLDGAISGEPRSAPRFPPQR